MVRAVLLEGHLPEAQFEWQPLDQLAAPEPDPTREPLLVRSISRPIPLPPASPHKRDDGRTLDVGQGSVQRIHGPYIMSGGWVTKEIIRHYHYFETSAGLRMWLYFDDCRKRWFQQGLVR